LFKYTEAEKQKERRIQPKAQKKSIMEEKKIKTLEEKITRRRLTEKKRKIAEHKYQINVQQKTTEG